jgi:glucan-binding YG repeat protein
VMAESSWLTYKNARYYLKAGGAMAVSERLRIGGKYYRFDGAGKRVG